MTRINRFLPLAAAALCAGLFAAPLRAGEEKEKVKEIAKNDDTRQKLDSVKDTIAKKFDSDGDGKLSDAEKTAATSRIKKEVMDLIDKKDRKDKDNDNDKDKDDEKEKEKAKESSDSKKDDDGDAPKASKSDPAAKITPGNLKRFDKDGDGQLNDAEMAALKLASERFEARKKAELVARFDKDRDGKLSKDEEKLAKSALATEKTVKPPKALPVK